MLPVATKRASQETHIEWLARLVIDSDRRKDRFSYDDPPAQGERRRWNLRARLEAAPGGRSSHATRDRVRASG